VPSGIDAALPVTIASAGYFGDDGGNKHPHGRHIQPRRQIANDLV
jgi:hypothetical protein